MQAHLSPTPPSPTRRRIDVPVDPVTGAVGSATQSLDRAMDLLEVVVGHTASGISLGSVAAIVGLSKPTAHRLLTGLRNGGMIDYDVGERLFFPAFKLYSMGQAAATRFDVIEVAAASVDRLAEDTGDTVFLSARSGDFVVCVARRMGAFPIKTLTLEVGDVRPLGVGANGVALLAALRDDEVERNLERHKLALRAWPRFDAASIRLYVAAARKNGLAFQEGLLMPEMSSLALGIRSTGGRIDAAISLAAINSRLQEPRRSSLANMLRQEVDAIERLMEERAEARPRN